MKKGYLIILSALVAVAGPALADPTSDLARSYYDYTVAEYCGLITPPVAMGHALLHHDLIARGNISPETDWTMRLKGSEEAEYQYQNWGLSGNKQWCRTDGALAVARFTSYFQRRELP